MTAVCPPAANLHPAREPSQQLLRAGTHASQSAVTKLSVAVKSRRCCDHIKLSSCTGLRMAIAQQHTPSRSQHRAQIERVRWRRYIQTVGTPAVAPIVYAVCVRCRLRRRRLRRRRCKPLLLLRALLAHTSSASLLRDLRIYASSCRIQHRARLCRCAPASPAAAARCLPYRGSNR